MNEKENFLGEMREASNSILEVSERMYSLAHSFYHVGNKTVADKLVDDSFLLRAAEQKINNAIGKKVTDDYDESIRISGAMLEHALCKTSEAKS